MKLSFSENINLLIVDDQLENLRSLSLLLNQAGYYVRKATSGIMAIATINADPPNLILLDIDMPEMDGYQVCSILKASDQTRQIPIIFLSAFDEAAKKTKAFAVGGADYITKPFQIEEVLLRVNQQLTLQQQQQQLILQNQTLQREIHERQRFQVSLQILNDNLESQVQQRTKELKKVLEYEALLKRITDKVRDSLDETRILQSAVEELATGLAVQGCNAGIYDLTLQNSTIAYEYVTTVFPAKGFVVKFSSAPELYQELLQGREIQFCGYQPYEERHPAHRYIILACPVFDDQGTLGDLWLFKPKNHSFIDIEVRLVKQVANQCAIALRQARLYQEATAQVHELQRLNQLKDDFLSTISHELRTPVANIQMITDLLITLFQENLVNSSSLNKLELYHERIGGYLEILKQECERELRLLQDLLDLQYLGSQTQPLVMLPLDISHWIPHVVESVKMQINEQSVPIEIELSPDLPAIATDPASLSRILTELITNACKYTLAGGKIKIQVNTEAENFYIRVINTATQIPSAEHQKIFDKFYRIPNNDPWKYGGTGIGLALVKKLVEYLGGMIDVSSENQITCFTVTLPLGNQVTPSVRID